MSEENSSTPASAGITLSISDLQALVAAAVKAATEDSTAMLAKALIESKKPYVDPNQKANDDFMKQTMKAATARMDREREQARANCSHKQGCNPLSEFESTKSAFAIHQLDTGEVIGICTNCGDIISSLNVADRKFFTSKQGGNRVSKAGQRVFIDPLGAQKARTESLKSVAQVAPVIPAAEDKVDDSEVDSLVANQPVSA